MKEMRHTTHYAGCECYIHKDQIKKERKERDEKIKNMLLNKCIDESVGLSLSGGEVMIPYQKVLSIIEKVFAEVG